MRKGFTLVELSIVLVIIGLLIGGILVAQSMITATKVSKQVALILQYEIAINNFRTTYKAYPGDSNLFTPPGNQNGVSNSNHPNCIGIYQDSETRQWAAHLSEAGMIAAKFIPYSPISCDGPQSNSPLDVSLAGVVYPYTELDAQSATAWSSNKYPLSFQVDSNGMPRIGVGSDNDIAIGVEQKLPTTTVFGTVGYFNLNGPGMCAYSGMGPYYHCTHKLARYAVGSYYMTPQ